MKRRSNVGDLPCGVLHTSLVTLLRVYLRGGCRSLVSFRDEVGGGGGGRGSPKFLGPMYASLMLIHYPRLDGHDAEFRLHDFGVALGSSTRASGSAPTYLVLPTCIYIGITRSAHGIVIICHQATSPAPVSKGLLARTYQSTPQMWTTPQSCMQLLQRRQYPNTYRYHLESIIRQVSAFKRRTHTASQGIEYQLPIALLQQSSRVEGQ